VHVHVHEKSKAIQQPAARNRGGDNER